MNTDMPIKLTDPLSEHPTEMWLQAIADFEVVLVTPGYEIAMDLWFERGETQSACFVCMAGASMVRRSQGLPLYAHPRDYAEQDRRKLCSINYMRRGYFEYALDWLILPEKEEAKWLEAIQAADIKWLRSSLYSVYIEKDWNGLIEQLREAIARIDAEYVRLSK